MLMKPVMRRPLRSLATPAFARIEGVGAPAPLSAYSPSNPLFISHRGSALLGPENTIEAMDAAVAARCQAMEFDVHALTDGGLGIMHDATVTRTTTSTGNVADLDTAGFTALNIDALSWHGTYSDTLHPPLLPDVIGRYKDATILIPEIKASGAEQGTVDALVNAGVSPTHCIVISGSLTWLDAAVTAGYPTMYIPVGTSQIAAAQAAGITWAALDQATESDATFQAWYDAGFKVVAYTVNRRWRLAQLQALGIVTAYVTDDPIYLSRAKPIRTSDNFAAQTWQPGMISGAGDANLTEIGRGRFFSPDQFGWNEQANSAWTLLGDMCPIASDPLNRDFTVDLSVKYNSAAASTNWWAMWFAETDRAYANAVVSTENGYLVMGRKNGTLQIYKVVAGAATSLVAQTGTTITDGTEVDFRITVGATTITLARLNGDGTVNYAGTTTGEVGSPIGCGYMHLGRSSCNARVRAISVA